MFLMQEVFDNLPMNVVVDSAPLRGSKVATFIVQLRQVSHLHFKDWNKIRDKTCEFWMDVFVFDKNCDCPVCAIKCEDLIMHYIIAVCESFVVENELL